LNEVEGACIAKQVSPLFSDQWDPTMRLYKDALALQREGLCSSPVKEDQESINQQEVEERVLDEGYQSHEEEQEFTHDSTKDKEDLVEEQELEDVNHEDEVLMCVPPFDEAIQDPIPPTQEEESEVNHFPFQVFDDALFYDSEGEEVKESLDELDPSCCNEGDDMIEEFIFFGRRRWDVVGHDGDPIYDIEGHFQLLPHNYHMRLLLILTFDNKEMTWLQMSSKHPRMT
jgi:hypothetical protein